MTYKKDIHHLHDKWYKMLLSNKDVAEQVIRTFIREPWTHYVQKANLELIDKSFVLADFEELEADLVYKTRIVDQEVIFYMLVEMQSSVDHSMPIRLFYYMAQIWREELRNFDKNDIKRKDFKLPAIVPIVLYNGEQPWTLGTSFKFKIQDYELFGNHVMNYEYILLDVNRYSRESLIEQGNLAAAIFLLDQKGDKEDFIENMKIVALSFNNMTVGERKKLDGWLDRILKDDFSESLKSLLGGLLLKSDKDEVEKMTANIVKTWREEKEEVTYGHAKKLLALGADIDLIVKGLGLTLEQIEEIRKKIKE